LPAQAAHCPASLFLGRLTFLTAALLGLISSLPLRMLGC